MAFPDDDPESKFPPDDPDLLKNRSIPQRAIVISAGVLANIVFAYSLLFTQASLHALSYVAQNWLPCACSCCASLGTAFASNLQLFATCALC